MARAARTIGALLSACAVLASGTIARAEPEAPSPRFVLAYDAHDDLATNDTCPDRAAFVAAVRARTPRSQLADGAEEERAAIHFRVTITTDATSSRTRTVVGQLDVREPDGAEQKRSVTSRSCREVAKALALVVALVLDPDATTSELVEPPLEAAPPPVETPAPPRPPPPRRVAPPAPPPAPTSSWHLAIGAELGATGGIGPAVAPLAGAFVDLALHTPRVFAFAPSFRLGVEGALTASDLAVGNQSYLWLAAVARACPIHLALPARLRVGPCAGMQIGVHRGATTDVPNPTVHSDLWLAPTAGGSLAWAVTPAVTVELDGFALFPLRRTRFFLAPNTTIYDVPAVAGAVTLGALVRFR